MAPLGDPRDGTNRVLVIVPTFNERDSLPGVVAGLLAASEHVDVLIVDDASPDGTGDVADALARDPRVRVRHRPAKNGLGEAYRAGFAYALEHGYHFIVECDADGSHLPKDLPALLTAVESGADLALGSRWIEGGAIVGWPWPRVLLSRLGTAAARVLLGSRLHDLTSGYRAFRADALARLPLTQIASQGYAFQVEVAWTLERSGSQITEVPITFVERSSGRSKMSFGIVMEACGMLLKWACVRLWAPSRLPRA